MEKCVEICSELTTDLMMIETALESGAPQRAVCREWCPMHSNVDQFELGCCATCVRAYHREISCLQFMKCAQLRVQPRRQNALHSQIFQFTATLVGGAESIQHRKGTDVGVLVRAHQALAS